MRFQSVLFVREWRLLGTLGLNGRGSRKALAHFPMRASYYGDLVTMDKVNT